MAITFSAASERKKVKSARAREVGAIAFPISAAFKPQPANQVIRYGAGRAASVTCPAKILLNRQQHIAAAQGDVRPIMKRARSLARNATTLAISWAVPRRPNAVRSKYQSGDAWFGLFSLTVRPDATWLTVTPLGPNLPCQHPRHSVPSPLARDVGGLVGPALHDTFRVDVDHPSPSPLHRGRHQRFHHQ